MAPTPVRCPCCYKKTIAVPGVLLEARTEGWCNLLADYQAARYAKEGICPWCGRPTTIVAKILMRRFAPTLASYARSFG